MMTKKEEDDRLEDDDPTVEEPTSDFLESLDPLKIVAYPPERKPLSDSNDDDPAEPGEEN